MRFATSVTLCSVCLMAGCGGGGGSGSPSPNPVPTVSSVSPTSAVAGSAAFSLTVNGTNFVSTSVVQWNGNNRTTTYVSATRLTAAIPSSDIGTVSTATVTVVNPAPGGGISAHSAFTVTPPLSSSKLGPHVLGAPNNAGAMTILDACPRVAKWVAPYGGIDLAVSDYKSHCPAGTVILRVYVPASMATYSAADDPIASANDYWNKMLTQGLSSAGQPNQIDWLEGPNELDNLPNWYDDSTAATWVASFWSTLADLMHSAGYKPLVGSLVAGQPSPVTAFAPLAAAMKSKGYTWGWSYHSLTFGATMDVGSEAAYALYYRQIRDQNGLGGIPLVLSEGGYLTTSSTGWQGRLTNDQYLSWLKWFDAQLKQDAEVSGLTIFQVGNTTDWQSFDLTPIAPELANYLTTGL